VWHDFSATPHLMVFGDGETGKTNVLRTIAGAITRHYGPDQARIALGDSGRQLHDVVPEAYRIGYAVSTDALANLAANAEVSMTKRLPGPDITPERLSKRDWWSGPKLFLLIDDYELFTTAGSMQCPMNSVVSLLAQGANIGMHVVVARSTSGAVRVMMDPLLRRIWELGNPALLLSYPKEEGKFLGEAAPRNLPPGRAQLVTRRGIKLVQTPIAVRESGGTPR
jgi:S-DNA-T family DNA segregation ATPase FtsK/SpoIIIE